MECASIFKSNTSQAVRLPKPVALPECEPEREGWDSWFDEKGVSNDFMSEREQPSVSN